MALIIDGYNLLHVTDIVGGGTGADSFQRTREALLNFLATSIPLRERKETTIVFDAAEAPPGLPDTTIHQEITVVYARDYPDADALIEEMVEQHSAPRSLLVVSSDHRIQRAARRRRAQYVDSDQWYANLWRRRVKSRKFTTLQDMQKQNPKLSASEVEYWVAKFNIETTRPSEADERPPIPPPKSNSENPFPPGYGEDLLGD